MMRALLLLLLLLAPSAASYKVLVYNSLFGHSHSNFGGRIADELAAAGHNVTTLIPVIRDGKPGTSKSRIIYVPTGPETKASVKALNPPGNDDDESARGNGHGFIRDPKSIIGNFVFGPKMAQMFIDQCRETLRHAELLEKLRDEHFDVYISESFDMCGLALSHVLKPKSVIWTSASTLFGSQYDEAGIAVHSSFNPSPYTTHLDPHSMISRLSNIWGELLFRQYFRAGRTGIDTLFHEHFDDFPGLMIEVHIVPRTNKSMSTVGTLRERVVTGSTPGIELSSRAAYVFSNAEPLLDYAHPTLHRIIDLGGIGATAPAPLSEEWEEVLARRERTMLLSFGSVAPSVLMPDAYKHGILNMISRFPDITFIWKYEKDDEFTKLATAAQKNVYFSKWTPQSDLLAHPKLVAFITHGGMGSCTETSRRGVPALLIPLFGDQPRNAGAMEKNHLGLVFDKYALADGEKLAAAVRQLLDDASYATAAQKMSRMLARRPFNATEKLLKYTAFAAEFGPSPALRPASFDMSLVELYNLDLLAIFLLFAITIVFAIVFLVAKVTKRFFRRSVTESTEKAKKQ